MTFCREQLACGTRWHYSIICYKGIILSTQEGEADIKLCYFTECTVLSQCAIYLVTRTWMDKPIVSLFCRTFSIYAGMFFSYAQKQMVAPLGRNVTLGALTWLDNSVLCCTIIDRCLRHWIFCLDGGAKIILPCQLSAGNRIWKCTQEGMVRRLWTA